MNTGALEYHYLVTFRITLVRWVLPPPIAVMIMMRFPIEAFFPTFTVIVDVPDPGAAMELGVKVTVWAFPCPEADNVIAELKLPVTAVVIAAVPDALLVTEIEVGAAVTVKRAGAVAVTVSEIVAVCVRLPSVPVIVML